MASTHETRFLLTAKNNTKAAFSSVRGDLKSLSTGTLKLTGAIAALAGGAGFALLGNGLVDTNIQFQTMKSALKTLTGSAESANKTFAKITEFATTTPFALTEVANAFIKLKAMGLEPSESALKSFGNTASAMGKSLDQMIEAVLDATTGEFERLKEFGIRAEKIPKTDLVKLMFRGTEKTLKITAENIQKYLEDIGNTDFAGAMADQMQNVGPAFDNFQTSIKELQVQIGEAGLNDALAGATNNLTAFIKTIDGSVVSDATIAGLQALADVLIAIDNTTGGIGKAFEFLSRGAYYDPVGELGALAKTRPGYQLGDFNRANGSQEDNFQNWARDIESGTFGRGSTEELTKQTGVLEAIKNGLDQGISARAG